MTAVQLAAEVLGIVTGAGIGGLVCWALEHRPRRYAGRHRAS